MGKRLCSCVMLQFCHILHFQCSQRTSARIRTAGCLKLLFTYQLELSNRDSHYKHLQLVAFLETFEIHRSFALLPFLWQILCRKRKFNPLRKKSHDNKNLPKTKSNTNKTKQHIPTEDTKNKIKNKERPPDNESNKVQPRPGIANCIINLKRKPKHTSLV